MGSASMAVLEIRFKIEPELLQVHVFIQGEGDCPIGVTGWHHKTFPASTAAIDFMKSWADGKEEPFLWPLNAP